MLEGPAPGDPFLVAGGDPAAAFYYFTETTFHGMRYDDWKVLFIDQEEWFRAEQVPLSTPIIVNLKLDPLERMIKARGYDEWAENRGYIFGQVGRGIAEFVATFKDFPPSQASLSLQVGNVSQVINSQAIGR